MNSKDMRYAYRKVYENTTREGGLERKLLKKLCLPKLSLWDAKSKIKWASEFGLV